MHHFFNFLIFHWILSLSFIIILIFFIINELSHLYFKNSISSFELVKLMNRKSILIIDCRNKHDYLKGHILNSVNLCIEDNDNFLKKNSKKTVILVCENGKISAKQSVLLSKKGYSDVKNLEGGIQSWVKDGFPLL